MEKDGVLTFPVEEKKTGHKDLVVLFDHMAYAHTMMRKTCRSVSRNTSAKTFTITGWG